MKPKSQDSAFNKILLVTNNPRSVEPYKQWFMNAGFLVDTTLDAIQAITQIQEKHYRLVLIDCQLDGEFAGLDVFWLLKPYINSDHIVMLSREIDKYRIQRVTSKGLHHLFPIPFDPKRSPAALEHALAEENHYSTAWNPLVSLKDTFHRVFATKR